MKKYIRATAALSAVVCGFSLLTFVPAAFAAPFDRNDNTNYPTCVNGETVIIKGYNYNRAQARTLGTMPPGTFVAGPCPSS